MTEIFETPPIILSVDEVVDKPTIKERKKRVLSDEQKAKLVERLKQGKLKKQKEKLEKVEEKVEEKVTEKVEEKEVVLIQQQSKPIDIVAKTADPRKPFNENAEFKKMEVELAEMKISKAAAIDLKNAKRKSTNEKRRATMAKKELQKKIDDNIVTKSIKLKPKPISVLETPNEIVKEKPKYYAYKSSVWTELMEPSQK